MEAAGIMGAHSPSWVDRLTDRVDRLPIPYWVVYLVLFFVVDLAGHLLGWVDGSIPRGQLDVDAIFIGFFISYALASMHHLDRRARGALGTFRPAVECSDSEYEQIGYEFTTMSARPVFLLSLIAPALALVLPAAGASDVGGTWQNPLTAFNYFLSFSVGWLLFPILIYHSWRQLRLVSLTYGKATRINLFNLDPLYAFSGLTARTGVGRIVIVTMNLLMNNILQEGSRHNLTSTHAFLITASQLLLATAAFVLPLAGIHRRIAEEKERARLEADQRMEASIGILHGRIDRQEVDGNAGLYRTMSSLVLEREVIDGIPTWPWQPVTLRNFLYAVFVPILLLITQQILERFAAF